MASGPEMPACSLGLAQGPPHSKGDPPCPVATRMLEACGVSAQMEVMPGKCRGSCWGLEARGPGRESLCHRLHLPHGTWGIMGRNLLCIHGRWLAPLNFNLCFIEGDQSHQWIGEKRRNTARRPDRKKHRSRRGAVFWFRNWKFYASCRFEGKDPFSQDRRVSYRRGTSGMGRCQ